MRILAAAVLVAAVATACGGSGGGASSSSDATTAATAAPPTVTAAPSIPAGEPVVLQPVGPDAPGGATIDGIYCETQEEVTLHIHAGLVIFLHGEQVTVPAYIGFNDDTCLYWLHTHADAGVIHIESPTKTRTFTLGEFFRIWGYPLSTTEIAGVPATVHAWVAGSRYMGDPAQIQLADGETIVLSDADIPVDQLPVVDTDQS